MNRAALAPALLLSLGARAESFDFGHRGQLVPAGSIGVRYTSAGNDSATTLTLSPAFSYFIADHVALGLAISYRLDKLVISGIDQGTRSTARLEPSASLDVPLSATLSFFPSGALAVSSRGDRRAFGVGAFAPILIHPVRHFFLGFGPDLFAELVATVPSSGGGIGQPTMGTSTAFTIAARSVIGGYF